jgi:hypothetical protein
MFVRADSLNRLSQAISVLDLYSLRLRRSYVRQFFADRLCRVLLGGGKSRCLRRNRHQDGGGSGVRRHRPCRRYGVGRVDKVVSGRQRFDFKHDGVLSTSYGNEDGTRRGGFT